MLLAYVEIEDWVLMPSISVITADLDEFDDDGIDEDFEEDDFDDFESGSWIVDRWELVHNSCVPSP